VRSSSRRSRRPLRPRSSPAPPEWPTDSGSRRCAGPVRILACLHVGRRRRCLRAEGSACATSRLGVWWCDARASRRWWSVPQPAVGSRVTSQRWTTTQHRRSAQLAWWSLAPRSSLVPLRSLAPLSSAPALWWRLVCAPALLCRVAEQRAASSALAVPHRCCRRRRCGCKAQHATTANRRVPTIALRRPAARGWQP